MNIQQCPFFGPKQDVFPIFRPIIMVFPLIMVKIKPEKIIAIIYSVRMHKTHHYKQYRYAKQFRVKIVSAHHSEDT